MKFREKLNEYINIIDCSGKELSKASGLSEVVISRYRSGEREPQKNEQIEKLASAIINLALAKGIKNLTFENVKAELESHIHQSAETFELFSKRFSNLIDELSINVKELSVYTSFDTSYIYRIKSGHRKPNDLITFADKVCQYVTTNYSSEKDIIKISSLIGLEKKVTKKNFTISDYTNHLKDWLCNTPTNVNNSSAISKSDENDSIQEQMGSFLNKLEEFNLDEYIRAIHFDELKVPNIPFYRPSTKNYYGVEEMRTGELDFLKGVVLSKSKEDVFMCSDMPLYDLAEDMDFNQKWMFGIAMCIKKGLHLNIIHNVDRPFNEMMLGLEAWMPIYMTGQISPYFLPNIDTSIYHHFNYVSGTIALTGECINGYHSKGKYYLTCKKDEVAYYREKAKNLLSKAKPLMEIYNANSKDKMLNFLESSMYEHGNRANIYYAPPIYTIPDKLLDEMLNNIDSNNVSNTEKIEIKKYIKCVKEETLRILQGNNIKDSLPLISREEFGNYPMQLSIDELFLKNGIKYTYDQYLAHINACKDYAENNTNYILDITDKCVFRNIQIHILEKKYVHISKNKAPSIHFIIRHKKMINALTKFI